MSSTPSHSQITTESSFQPFTPWCKSCWDSLSPATQHDLESVSSKIGPGYIFLPDVEDDPSLIISQCKSHASELASTHRQNFAALSTELREKYPEKWPREDKDVWDMLVRVEADRQAETDETRGSTRRRYLHSFTANPEDHDSLIGLFGCYRGICEDHQLSKKSLPWKVISLAPLEPSSVA